MFTRGVHGDRETCGSGGDQAKMLDVAEPEYVELRHGGLTELLQVSGTRT